MLHRCVALLFVAILLVPLSAQEQGEKKAVPDATAQGKAEALITRLFAAKLKAARTDKAAASALAAELLAQGKTTNDDDALQFVALKWAAELAAGAGDNATALETIEVLAKHFKVDTLGMKSNIYAQAEKGTTDKDVAIDLVEAVLSLVEDALTVDNFAVADQLLATADKAVTKSGKLALAARVTKRGQEVEDARKAFDSIKPLLTKAGKELEVGKYYCFTKGNYEKGLPLLAKSKDAALKALAERDLAEPTDPRKQIELADDWHKLAEEQKGLAQRQTFRRALHWFQAAQPKLEGLTRVRVDRQVTELAKLFPVGSSPALSVEITTELRKIDPGHTGHIGGVAVSGDGKLILSCGNNGTTLRLWDGMTGQKKKDLVGSNSGFQSVSISPDGKWGVSGSDDGTVRLWDLETGKEIRRLNNTAGIVYTVRFLPNGKQVLIGTGNGGISLVDATTGNQIKNLLGHTQLVYDISISKDGKRAISGSYDQTVRLWDLEKGVEIRKFQHQGMLIRVALSPDGKRAVTSTLSNIVTVWDVETGKELFRLDHPGMVWSLAISPDGRRIYTGCGGGKWGGGNNQPATRENSEIRVWDLTSGKELRLMRGHTNWVWAMAFSANGRYLVTGSHDSSVRVWGAK